MRNKDLNFFKGRANSILFIFFALLALLVARFFFLQVVKGTELKELRELTGLRDSREPANIRGFRVQGLEFRVQNIECSRA